MKRALARVNIERPPDGPLGRCPGDAPERCSGRPEGRRTVVRYRKKERGQEVTTRDSRQGVKQKCWLKWDSQVRWCSQAPGRGKARGPGLGKGAEMELQHGAWVKKAEFVD